jgi:hypothetical protein
VAVETNYSGDLGATAAPNLLLAAGFVFDNSLRNPMESQQDLIVDIPKERIRFFGGGGKMLLPSAPSP